MQKRKNTREANTEDAISYLSNFLAIFQKLNLRRCLSQLPNNTELQLIASNGTFFAWP